MTTDSAPGMFGTRIKQMRAEKGLSMGQLAAKLKTTKSYVCGWETGNSKPPSAPFIRRIARFFRVDAKPLLTVAFAQKAPKEIRSEVLLKLTGIRDG